MGRRFSGHDARLQQDFDWNAGPKSDFNRALFQRHAKHTMLRHRQEMDESAYLLLERMLDFAKGDDRITISLLDLKDICGRSVPRVRKSLTMLEALGLIECVPRRDTVAGISRVATSGYRFIRPPQPRTKVEEARHLKPRRDELGMPITRFKGTPQGWPDLTPVKARNETATQTPRPDSKSLHASVPYESYPRAAAATEGFRGVRGGLGGALLRLGKTMNIDEEAQEAEQAGAPQVKTATAPLNVGGARRNTER